MCFWKAHRENVRILSHTCFVILLFCNLHFYIADCFSLYLRSGFSKLCFILIFFISNGILFIHLKLIWSVMQQNFSQKQMLFN